MQLRALLLTVLCFFSLFLLAQPPSYPKNYFRNPLGITMELAANFGELRPSHWHMGLDIRTAQKENLPVYAAADGYIAHIGIRPQSFGRFIIINHPNGLSTLYAHLNDFYPELEEYVTAQQYKQESWAVELNFDAKQFLVYKSRLIAYSGNTGGSQGPHLHFEIFDTKTEKRFNPLLFGFPLQDNVTPTLVKLALYDRNRTVYDQTPAFFYLKNTDSGYIIPKMPVLRTGLHKISFAIQAYDRLSGSTNPNGIFSAKLYLDDQPQLSFVLDSIDYDETVYMNAHIDYKEKANGGSYLQHLSQLPGDRGAAYKQIRGDGVISFADTSIHQVSIDVKDANNNTSQINFAIQYSDSLASLLPVRLPSYHFAPNKVNELKKPNFEMYLPEGCLYDSILPLYFQTNPGVANAVSDLHQVSDATLPLHQDITVRIKPNKAIPAEWKDKMVMIRSSRGNTIRKAQLENNWLIAKFSDLGTFRAYVDLTSPQINELGKSDTINLSAASRIVFTPTDNFGIPKFRAELDSQWIRFTNDKSRNWIYTFDERCPYGMHELKVTVEDIVGNTITKTWWFKRYPYTAPKKKAVKKGNSKKKEADKKKKSATSKKTASKKKK
jgi:hypothetical protein